MFIQKTDLLKDLGAETVGEINKIMVEETYGVGQVVFTPKDAANHLYILAEGEVRLSVGEEAEIDYTVSHPGEVFGWSCMVDRETYPAKAECMAPTKLVKIEKKAVSQILATRPADGMLFFKRLAGCVAQRLWGSYQAFLSEGSLKGITSYGTGQVVAGAED